VRVLFCGSGWFPIADAIAERLPGSSVEIWDRSIPLARSVAGIDVILPSNGRIDAAVIAAAESLVLIQQPASGYDGVDLAAARARDIPVCNAPAANHISVAETAAFLMLALARRAPIAARRFERAEIGEPLGVEMAGKTLGIVGLGRSGAALARIGGGLGMTVRHTTSRSSRDDLIAMLISSDVISIHCPLAPETRGLFDDALLARIKPGALLINCARGPIIDRGALERALDNGLGGVGLDTFWDEPWDPSDPLYARDDVVTLPHVGGSSVESFARIADIVAANIGRVGRGEEPLHRVA
jgi:phosphoglycerate dehydrogenase-like enzyme